ncbi:MAG: MBL fold metallo-hydrolase [bacterium]|nr:MBL fold metallo-hydrolase [bacterium]
MQIYWHGFSSIRIEAKSADTNATLVTDPYQNTSGLRFPRTLEPDVVVMSHPDQEEFNLESFANAPYLISEPGEYEKAGIFVRGVPSSAVVKAVKEGDEEDPEADRDEEDAEKEVEEEKGEEKESKQVGGVPTIVYRFDAEDISLGFLGQINRQLTSREIETLGEIDILFIPVGGGDVLDAKSAHKIIDMIEPRIVIPMYYDVDGVKEKLDSVDSFCKALGSCARENVNKLKITSKDLPQDSMKVIVIERA